MWSIYSSGINVLRSLILPYEYSMEFEASDVGGFRNYRWPILFTVLLMGVLYSRIVPGMVSDWYHDPNYSHGFLVPLISAYFLYERRGQLRSSAVRPNNLGLLVVVGSLLLLIAGYVGTEYFSMRSSLIFLIAGIVLYWFGWEILKILALPIGYLLFMVPLPYIVYDAIAFPLKLFVAQYSVKALKAMSIIVLREGNIIMFPQVVLEVADACSGLRSLMSLLALSVAYAFLSQKVPWKRGVLIAAAVPIAIVTNGFRVIATGVLAQYWGARAAEGFFHEFAGLVVFGLAIVLLISTGALLKRVGR